MVNLNENVVLRIIFLFFLVIKRPKIPTILRFQNYFEKYEMFSINQFGYHIIEIRPNVFIHCDASFLLPTYINFTRVISLILISLRFIADDLFYFF